MISLLTNTASMSAMRALKAAQKELATTEKQISTGLRVTDASDNVTSWSIATAMRSRISDLSAVNDGLNLTTAVMDTTQAGLKSVLADLDKIRAATITAAQPGANLAAIQLDIAGRQTSIRNAISSATFNGVNLLHADLVFDGSGNRFDQYGTSGASTGASGYASALSVPVTIGPNGAVVSTSLFHTNLQQTQYFSATTLNASNFGTASRTFANDDVAGVIGSLKNYAGTGSLSMNALNLDVTSLTSSERRALPDNIRGLINGLTASAAQVGGQMNTVSMMRTFNLALSDALTSGVGALVDAEMNIASTHLTALQTRVQLGVLALSIANGNSKMMLKLFGA